MRSENDSMATSFRLKGMFSKAAKVNGTNSIPIRHITVIGTQGIFCADSHRNLKGSAGGFCVTSRKHRKFDTLTLSRVSDIILCRLNPKGESLVTDLELKEMLSPLVRGENADWNALFERLEPVVLAICTDFFAAVDDAQDAAQEVCLMVYRKAALIAATDAPMRYVRRIARNHCIDLYRRSEKRAALNDAEPIDETVIADPTGKSDPQNRFTASTVSDAVAEMIDTLPVAQQEVLRLKYNEDLTTREIAQRLSIPEGTVSSRLYYAHLAIEKKVLSYEKKHKKKLRLNIPFTLLPWRRFSEKYVINTATVAEGSAAAETAKHTAAAMAVVTGATVFGAGALRPELPTAPLSVVQEQENDAAENHEQPGDLPETTDISAMSDTASDGENTTLTRYNTVVRDIPAMSAQYRYETVPATEPEPLATEAGETSASNIPHYVGSKYESTLLKEPRLAIKSADGSGVTLNMPEEWVNNVNVEQIDTIFFSGSHRWCKGYAIHDSELFAYPALQSEEYALFKLFVTNCPPENGKYPEENLLGSCTFGSEKAWLYLQPQYSLGPITHRIEPSALADAISGIVDHIEAADADLYHKNAVLAILKR